MPGSRLDAVAGSRSLTPPNSLVEARKFKPNAKGIAVVAKLMEDEVKGVGRFKPNGGDIPAIDLVAAMDGVLRPIVNQVTIGNRLDFGGPCHYEVAAMPKDGVLDFTLLCPVSGHCGLDNAKAWAGLDPKRRNDANIMTVTIRLGDGRTITAGSLKATSYVTPVNFSIPLVPGTTTIEFVPSAQSAGVGGYHSGRTLEIKVPKKVAPTVDAFG